MCVERDREQKKGRKRQSAWSGERQRKIEKRSDSERSKDWFERLVPKNFQLKKWNIDN